MYQINDKQLTFLDSRFYKTDDGGFVPSVTTILECYPKGAAYYNWLKENGKDSDEIRDEAGRRGSVVHKLTEDYDTGAEVQLVHPLRGVAVHDDKGVVGAHHHLAHAIGVN
jgi:hypothetical protein